MRVSFFNSNDRILLLNNERRNDARPRNSEMLIELGRTSPVLRASSGSLLSTLPVELFYRPYLREAIAWVPAMIGQTINQRISAKIVAIAMTARYSEPSWPTIAESAI